MSYPILYKADETDFTHLGLGVLSDVVSALVVEERNGRFELEMRYPLDGKLFKEIKNDRIIKVDAAPNLKDQLFKIYRVTRSARSMSIVYAEHVSYLAQYLALEPEVSFSGNAQAALNAWSASIIDDHPFAVYSDIETTASGKWLIYEAENARRALGGSRGSMLDTYGGEYLFDNYRIMLLKNRGEDSGALIAYGKNLTDLEQDEEIASTYTSVYPYYIILHEDGTEEILTLPEKYVDSEHVNKYARRKILTLNLTEEEGISTVEQLRVRTQKYIEDNNVGVPKVNLRIKYIDLAKTLDYKDLTLVEEINLCDTVTVYFEKLDIYAKAKVVKTVWDVLLDQYDEIEIGEARASLSKSINDNIVENTLKPVQQQASIALISANGKSRIYKSAETPPGGQKDDIWYKPVGLGEVEMYIHNGLSWDLQAYSGDQVRGTINFGNVNAINLNANSMTAGILKGGRIYFDLDGGEFFCLDEQMRETFHVDGNTGHVTVKDQNNQAIMTPQGLKAIHNLTSSGEYSGWQMVGIKGLAQPTTEKYQAGISAFIPENFIVESATLYTRSASSYITGYQTAHGVPDGYYHGKNLGLYIMNADAMIFDYPQGSSYGVWYGPAGTNITTPVWGSRWSPTGGGVKVKIGDVKDYLTPGEQTLFVVETSDNPSSNTEADFSLMKFDLVIEGFLRG